jgi:SAM-dependent methyltransferase
MVEFNEEILSEINDICEKSLKNDSSELEIRIGKFNKFGFNPGVSKERYLKIFNLDIFKKIEKENTICFLSNSNYNNLRETWFFDENKKKILEDGKLKKITIQKEKVSTIDIKNNFIRISLSNENIKTNNITCKSNFARYKIRTSKYTKDNLWRYDFTEVHEIRIRNKKDIKKWSELNEPTRYEIEIEFMKLNKVNLQEKFMKNLNYIISILESNAAATKNEVISEIYNNLDCVKKNGFKNMNFRDMTNQPKTLELQYINQIQENHYVTEKNDGERCILFLSEINNNIYLLNSKLDLKVIGKCEGLKSFLIDGELMKSKNNIIIFDILLYNKKDITDEDFDNRYSYLKDIIEKFSNIDLKFNVILKEFLYDSENIFNSCKSIIGKNKLLTDGLIFIPKNKKYFNKTYKWKPEELNTIDFLVKKVDEGVFHLYVGISKNVADLHNIKKIHNFNTVFKVLKNVQTKYYFPTKFSLPGNENLYIINSNSELLKDNTIVEFKYENQEWIPIRIREDKYEAFLKGRAYGNDWNVAVNNFNSIKNPITRDMITGNSNIPVPKIHFHKKVNNESSKNMRKFHSEIKTKYYQKYISENSNILDLAGGKGQDIKKFIECNPNTCVIIDIDKNAIFDAHDSAVKRFKQISKNTNTNSIFKFGLGDISKNISKNIDDIDLSFQEFDIITCNFAIMFLMKSNISFNNFIKNVNKYLKKDGILILTYFNGNKVFNLLETNDIIEFKDEESKTIFKISKEYEKKNKILKYGQQISVDINSIGCHSEYLVNNQHLITSLEKINMSLLETTSFADIKSNIELNTHEREFSHLNMISVFKKN